MIRDTVIHRLSDTLEPETPGRILRWAWDRFGPEMAATSSFQSQSVPLLHMISRSVPDLPVLFLDTGFHFGETLEFRDRLARELGLNLKILRPGMGHDGFRREHGELFRTHPDLCCHINKVEPLQRERESLQAWVTGIRRDQTANRRAVPIVSRLDDGTYRICPLAAWSAREVAEYRRRHRLPSHPLEARGYPSIGCSPCTRRVAAAEGYREGRWAGREKSECGLHGEGNGE